MSNYRWSSKRKEISHKDVPIVFLEIIIYNYIRYLWNSGYGLGN